MKIVIYVTGAKYAECDAKLSVQSMSENKVKGTVTVFNKEYVTTGAMGSGSGRLWKEIYGIEAVELDKYSGKLEPLNSNQAYIAVEAGLRERGYDGRLVDHGSRKLVLSGAEVSFMREQEKTELAQMSIYSDTTANEIAEYFSFGLPDSANKLVTAIEKYAEFQVSGSAIKAFRGRLIKQSIKNSENWHIGHHDMEFINDVADRLPADAKANLMNLTYDDISKLKRQWEKAIFKELIEFLEADIVDRYDNIPIDFPDFIETVEKKRYTQEHFLKLLRMDKIMVPRVIKILEALKRDFKILEEDEQ